MDFRKALEKGAKILEAELIKELDRQGHKNTGSLEASFTYISDANAVEGYANDYAGILDSGYASSSVSWKQLPFLIEYFKSKGLEPKEAKQAAAATIVVWMRDGVPTKGSSRFSKDGNRLNFIQIVEYLIQEKVNATIISECDRQVDILFNKTKSEII